MPQYQIDKDGNRVEPGDPGYRWNRESTSFDPVAEARAYLDNQTGPNETANASTPEELAALIGPRKHQMPSGLGALRGFTEMLAKPAAPLGKISLSALVASAIPGAAPVTLPIASGAGTLATMFSAPDIARRALLPDTGESRTGALGEGAMYAALPALGKYGPRMATAVKDTLGSMRGFQAAAKPAGWVGKSAASAYGGVGANASNFDEAAHVAQNAEQQLPESWKQFVKPSTFRGKAEPVAPFVKPATETPQDLIRQMNQQSAAGYRNVPSSSNPGLEGFPENNLASITPDEWKKLGLRQVRQTTPTHLNENADWGPNLMDNFRRLAIPARSRAYRE